MLALYRIVNVTNGKFYVGSSIVVKTRLRTHRRDLRNGSHHCSYLQRAWNKYGEESFKFEIIEYFDDKVLLIEAEDRWLSVHQGQSHCYNTGRTAKASFLGRTHADETKAKVSAAQKGKQHRLGHTNSPEHRARQSAGMKGIKKSPEHCEKIRQRMIGTSYAKGRIVSEEVRDLFRRPVNELTTGKQFRSVGDAAEHFGLQRANVNRTLRNGGILKRGPNAGLHFQYVRNVL
jgi:group I intron endonuclease